MGRDDIEAIERAKLKANEALSTSDASVDSEYEPKDRSPSSGVVDFSR